MKILHATSIKVPSSEFDKIGATRIAKTFFINNPKMYDLVANDEPGLYSNVVNKLYHVPSCRSHGIALYNKLGEISGEYDMVIMHLQFVAFALQITRLAQSFRNTKFVVVHHNAPDMNTDISYRYRKEFAEHFSQPNVYTICLTNNHRERLVGIADWLSTPEHSSDLSRILTIYNGSEFCETEITPISSRPFDTIVISRLDMSKYVLETLTLLLACDNVENVLYIGDSENSSSKGDKWVSYLNDFHRLKEAHPDRLKCVGPIDNKDVCEKWMPLAKVHVNLSYLETFGLTAIEAANAGVPSIVHTKGGGLPELVNLLDAGMVVDFSRKRFKGRVEILNDAISRVKNIQDSKLHEVRSLCRSKFDVNTMINSYHQI